MILRPLRLEVLVALLVCAPAFSTRAEGLSAEQTMELLRKVDAHEKVGSDVKALVQITHKQGDKLPVVREALIYKREDTTRMTLIFTKPKTEQGQGYLMVDRNLWFYDPSVGRWERRTERDRIAGTDLRRSDFDSASYVALFNATYEGEEKLGTHVVQKVLLNAKPDKNLEFPIVKIYIEKSTLNILKREEFALSGKLIRSSYYPKWQSVVLADKKTTTWYAVESRRFDEVDKTSSTTTVVLAVENKVLEDSFFTKAWLESKSR